MLAIGNVPGSGNPMNTHQMCQQDNAQWQPVMISPVLPYPMLQPTSGQQVPINHFITPIQHHVIPPTHNNYTSENYTNQQLQRMTYTSEEEEETQNNSKNEWQVIRRTKRKKIHRTQHNTPKQK